MEMKVYDRNPTGAAADLNRTQESQKTESGSTKGASPSSRSSGSDHVEFSGTLGRLSKALSTQGSERAAKVASLAAAYKAGTYKPDAAGASKGMVSEALSASGGH